AAMLPIITFLTSNHATVLIACIILPLSFPSVKTVFTSVDGTELNDALAFTGKLLVLYSVLFSAGWLI
ncbi:MAG: 1,4-dihydroxy-2-naphthoate polyprenyltransferase, partial [Candidatus Omnitrophota bacterium]